MMLLGGTGYRLACQVPDKPPGVLTYHDPDMLRSSQATVPRKRYE